MILMHVLLIFKVLDLIPLTNFGGLAIELDKISDMVLLVFFKVSEVIATPTLTFTVLFTLTKFDWSWAII